MSIFIGVDPGKSGAYGRLCTTNDGKIYGYDVHPWDDAEFVKWASAVDQKKHGRIVAAVEKVGAVHGNGITSTFTFGKNAGYIEGVLAACGIPYQLVPPATWKRIYSLIGKDKTASIEACKRLIPGIILRRTDKCRTDDHNMAEAVLLAEYARRKL